jgi:magnesium transporter
MTHSNKRKGTMMKFFKKASQRIGLSPGTLVHVGEKKVEKIRIRIIDYDETQLQEREVETIEECFPLKDTPTVSWINIDGLHDIEVIERIGKHFGLHPLILEDIVNTDQRPKIEDYEDRLFMVLKLIEYDDNTKQAKAEQLSLVLGLNFVISFQERVGDFFEPVRGRIRKKKSRLRRMKADYLAYALVDTAVDHYFIILEKLGERIERMEAELIENPKPETLQEIHALKRELIYLRKSVWPLREVISSLEREESSLIQDTTEIFLRDLYDHTIQVIDTVETLRDMVAGLLDIYLSSLSNKMNEVMKVLTLIATIFIPLTFIAGIYGMNFEYMPELKWHWGYPVVWLIMVFIIIFMIIYFKRKKWL